MLTVSPSTWLSWSASEEGGAAAATATATGPATAAVAAVDAPAAAATRVSASLMARNHERQRQETNSEGARSERERGQALRRDEEAATHEHDDSTHALPDAPSHLVARAEERGRISLSMSSGRRRCPCEQSGLVLCHAFSSPPSSPLLQPVVGVGCAVPLLLWPLCGRLSRCMFLVLLRGVLSGYTLFV
jgi:hypothetical protein